MEFAFDINELLPDDITLVDGKVAPFRGKHTRDRFEFSTKQAELKKVIDMTGEASARAQGLRSPITSAMKLSHSDHKLYISKDASANSGKGAVVGLIKIGYKRLFLLDYQGNQHEVNPLCVLDFYVHESRQRKGCGKSLFQHFLKMEGIEPHMLAIDRPSPKFLSFLKKHYNLDKSIPQVVNNFVVFVEFFRDLQGM
ncbi:predicted protein [Nematostella vectensis]|uniref:Alpha-tubulin N-acetyltransferase n=1 Tax=Nematostella vectensis TaxID=45351 RepID=A7SKG6_NEMVE|nr:predicted protein [Nematostella vectensis]|eukprot:XP_001627866.1 predicted protein [Nematostella vectensis]